MENLTQVLAEAYAKTQGMLPGSGKAAIAAPLQQALDAAGLDLVRRPQGYARPVGEQVTQMPSAPATMPPLVQDVPPGVQA